MPQTRVHRVTHPVFGVVSWDEMKVRLKPLRRDGTRVCSWCLTEIRGKNFRTICEKFTCVDAVARACFWNKCRATVLRRDRRICQLCESRAGVEVDHIVPIALGGTGDLENLRTLCRACHASETARFREEGEAFTARRRELTTSPLLRF